MFTGPLGRFWDEFSPAAQTFYTVNWYTICLVVVWRS
jgi:hypothetical protein